MTQHMLDFLRAFAWHADMRGPVLEIGSYIEEHQGHLDTRQAFSRSTPYLGVDVLMGPGVDKQVDLLDVTQMDALLDGFAPSVTLCLYVVEHIWDIHGAMRALGGVRRRFPESWLWVTTHQTQPYHGTKSYPDYWRVTAQAMSRLLDEDGGVAGGRVLVHPDSSNPSDVIGIYQPASVAWPHDALASTYQTISSHWEQVV